MLKLSLNINWPNNNNKNRNKRLTGDFKKNLFEKLILKL